MTDTAAASRAPMEHRSEHRSEQRSDAQPEQVADFAAPLAVEAGCALYDVQWRGGTLVVLASGIGGGPVDVDALSRFSRNLSAALDAADMIESSYVLEVSSPGLERRLRSPEHFAGAIGERVVIRTEPGELPRRRIVGEVVAADDHGVTVRADEVVIGGTRVGPGNSETAANPTNPANPANATDPIEAAPTMVIAFDDISKARTTFEWGPPARPAAPGSTAAQKKSGRVSTERQRR